MESHTMEFPGRNPHLIDTLFNDYSSETLSLTATTAFNSPEGRWVANDVGKVQYKQSEADAVLERLNRLSHMHESVNPYFGEANFFGDDEKIVVEDIDIVPRLLPSMKLIGKDERPFPLFVRCYDAVSPELGDVIESLFEYSNLEGVDTMGLPVNVYAMNDFQFMLPRGKEANPLSMSCRTYQEQLKGGVGEGVMVKLKGPQQELEELAHEIDMIATKDRDYPAAA